MKILLLLIASSSACGQSLVGIIGDVRHASGTVATPTDSPGAGTYGSTQSVTLSDSTSGSTICYTIDGSTPGAATPGTCDSPPTTTYSTAISVSSTTTIKAIGTKAGFVNSSVLSSTYTIAAAPTFVNAQSNENSGSSVTTIATAGISHTAGNALAVGCSFNISGASPTVTVTNTAGDTFTQVDKFDDGFTLITTATFYAKNIAGNASDVVTCTLSTARTTPGITVMQFTGLNTSAPLDQHVTGNTDSSATVTSASFTTTSASEVIVAFGTAYTELNPQTWTADTGYTIPSGGASGFGASVGEYKIVSSIQTAVTASLNWSVPNFMNIGVMTFK